MDIDIRDKADYGCVKNIIDTVSVFTRDLDPDTKLATVHVAFAVSNLSAIMDAIGMTHEMFTSEQISELGLDFLKANVAEFHRYCDMISQRKVH